MQIRTLALRDFRNVAEARLGLEGNRQFLVGANGQGKTNLLEAAGCLTALRSFRTSDTEALIRQGAAEAQVTAEVEHERRGSTRLALALRATGKEVWADQERVKRLADYLGQFPVVAFSSQDIQLIRGAPALRRRWLDMTLASMDAGYLQALQAFSRALTGRNKLLKKGAAAAAELIAFERVMAPAAAELVRLRREGVEGLARAAGEAYAKVSGGAEGGAVRYRPGEDSAEGPAVPGRSGAPDERRSEEKREVAGAEPGLATGPAAGGEAGGGRMGAAQAQFWLEAWEAGRAADMRMRSTLKGPHRDDLELLVDGRSAREFASEGQQRSLVLALRLAQTSWFQRRSGARPVILADDVLGELDPVRRRAFWAALDPAAQVIATGTAAPDPELGSWQVFRVEGGRFTLVVN